MTLKPLHLKLFLPQRHWEAELSWLILLFAFLAWFGRLIFILLP